ncbi:MAG: guanylate kinase, partial [Thermodesulfobacteriota bacterium]
MEQGKLFVISAPSGVGKTTLCRRLLDRISGLSFSVSY